MTRKQINIGIIVASILLAAIIAGVVCLSSGGDRVEEASESRKVEKTEHHGADLLKAVPSDAVAIMLGYKLRSIVETIPVASYMDLPMQCLGNELSIASFHFIGDLVPIVICHAGHNGIRPEGMDELLDKALELGIKTRFIAAAKRSGRHNLLIMSTSDNLIAACERNLDENACILDIESFANTLERVKPYSESIIVRNDALHYIVPKSTLSTYVSRTVLSKFMSEAAEWMILRSESVEPSGNGVYQTYNVTPVTGGSKSYYLSIYENIPSGESKIVDMLHFKTSFVLDIPVASFEQWMQARKAFLDSRSRLTQYNADTKKVRRKGQPSPEEWAAKLDIKEVARVYWKGGEVLVVRPAKTQVAHNTKPYPFPGYLAPLFGASFKLQDESTYACIGHWIVIGSNDSVKRFISSERKIVTQPWPVKNTKFVVLGDNLRIFWSKQEMKLQLYRSN